MSSLKRTAEVEKIGYFSSNHLKEVIDIEPELLLKFGIKEEFHPSLKLVTEDFPCLEKKEKIQIESYFDDLLKNPYKTSETFSRRWMPPTDTTEWELTLSATRVTEKGLVSKTKIIKASTLFPLWYNKLDFVNKQCFSDSPRTQEHVLSERDLTLLRMLILNKSRKDMAIKVHLSVKSIEKILTKYRSNHKAWTSENYGVTNITLEEGLALSGFSEFLLANENWLSKKGSFYAY